jgi:hypothetical protein
MTAPRITYTYGSALSGPPQALAHTPDFQRALGNFFVAWAHVELLTSYAIGKLLKISDEEAHVLTAGMEFGRKARLLRNLAYRDETHRRGIMSALNKLTKDLKRDVFAHSYLLSNPQTATFVDRARGGDYDVTPHQFTRETFVAYVNRFHDAGHELEAAIDALPSRLDEFANAAFSAAVRAGKSPQPPISSA